MHDEFSPFPESLGAYCTREFPFRDHVQRTVRAVVGDPEQTLCTLKKVPRAKAEISCTLLDEGFQSVYRRFVKDVVRKELGEEYVLFERNPNLRVQPVSGGAPTAPHLDADHMHSPCEINYWVPLTLATGTNTIWTESWPEQGDFHSVECDYGQVFRFYGNQCLHFSVCNAEPTSRVSFDFRVVRLSDFARSRIPLAGERKGCKWVLYGYYSVMGPDGEVPRESFANIAASAPHPARFQVPALERPRGEQRRSRSASEEHLQRCIQQFGSARAARAGCCRCGWIANRAKIRESLVCSLGPRVVPWIAEQPDSKKPWGLGCIVCAAVAEAGLPGARHTSYADFEFGTTPGLMLQPLVRHGNNGKWDSTSVDDNGKWAGARGARQDMVRWRTHAEAVQAINRGDVPWELVVQRIDLAAAQGC
mmetsp:Transcript_1844/g.4069  ORF Transcript_1844/g.4069 Transcript_1844/m.4069 type:complete len:420 (+) Transcript_1844:23-1282(+)